MCVCAEGASQIWNYPSLLKFPQTWTRGYPQFPPSANGNAGALPPGGLGGRTRRVAMLGRNVGQVCANGGSTGGTVTRRHDRVEPATCVYTGLACNPAPLQQTEPSRAAAPCDSSSRAAPVPAETGLQPSPRSVESPNCQDVLFPKADR